MMGQQTTNGDGICDALELFVPGRLCLFGEHSDWAGAMRKLGCEIRIWLLVLIFSRSQCI